MKLKEVTATIEPFELGKGMMKVRVRVRVETEKQVYMAYDHMLEGDHLVSWFDRIWGGLGEHLKREMKDAGE